MSGPPARKNPQPPVSDSQLASLLQFFSIEVTSGLLLLGAAAVALVWANSAWASHYFVLWAWVPIETLRVHGAPVTLGWWINDALMTLFFLLVGLEIRRELHHGALASVRLASLPLMAALGGVLLPAAIYLSFNHEPVTRVGWAVPTATDIAFALGVLALLGRRVPNALRVLLLAIAIIDDIIAVLIIAFFYAQGIALQGLLLVLAGVALVLILQRRVQRTIAAFVLPALLIWYGMLIAHIHPAIAGVVLGLLTPVHNASGRPVARLEAALHPWVAYGVMPLFALANAGVELSTPAGTTAGLSIGVLGGLLLGKPLGIVLAARLAVSAHLCALPAEVTWRGIAVIGVLAGIGFTMAIFIANLAFHDAALLAQAKLAVMGASLLAAIAGLLLGVLLLRP